MSTSNFREIELPFRHGKNKRVSVEKLPAEQIGPNQFRLVSSPGMVEGLAAGDEIELAPKETTGYRLLNRSKNLCIWFYFSQIGQNTGPEAKHICDAVTKIGGRLDGGGQYSLVFTIPVSIGFPTIEEIFNEEERRLPGSTWMFANVYDPRDGQTPLNWWND